MPILSSFFTPAFRRKIYRGNELVCSVTKHGFFTSVPDLAQLTLKPLKNPLKSVFPK
jgi:hypothetical protein